jgi:protoporphyrinogen oxidase
MSTTTITTTRGAPTMTDSTSDTTVILGAGPAGLSAAYALTREGRPFELVEKASEPGGLCRTFEFHGRSFDLGPHVFINRSPEIGELLHELGGERLKEITHIEGIYFDGKLYDTWLDAVVKLRMTSRARAFVGLLARRMRPIEQVVSCEDGLVNSYGSAIYSQLVRVHQRKFWGVDPSEIDVSWARVYEKPNSIFKYAKQRLSHSGARSASYEPAQTYYPTAGSQVIYGAMMKRIKEGAGSTVRLGSEVVAVHRDGDLVTHVDLRDPTTGEITQLGGRSFISTIPVTELVSLVDPAPPQEILDIAGSLRYRSLVVVNLLTRLTRDLPYGWVEIHSSDVQAGRLTNFARLSPEMAGEGDLVPVCLEYYCDESDAVWGSSDEEMIALARREMATMGFAGPEADSVGFVQRERFAYPMYLLGYGELRARLKEYCSGMTNLQSIGRGGIYRYNNMGHSIESGLRAAENVVSGQRHDLWDRSVVDGKI